MVTQLNFFAKRITGKQRQIASASYEALQLGAFVEAVVLIVPDAKIGAVAVKKIGFGIVISIDAVIDLVALRVEPQGEKLIPRVEITQHARLQWSLETDDLSVLIVSRDVIVKAFPPTLL